MKKLAAMVACWEDRWCSVVARARKSPKPCSAWPRPAQRSEAGPVPEERIT